MHAPQTATKRLFSEQFHVMFQTLFQILVENSANARGYPLVGYHLWQRNSLDGFYIISVPARALEWNIVDTALFGVACAHKHDWRVIATLRSLSLEILGKYLSLFLGKFLDFAELGFLSLKYPGFQCISLFG